MRVWIWGLTHFWRDRLCHGGPENPWKRCRHGTQSPPCNTCTWRSWAHSASLWTAAPCLFEWIFLFRYYGANPNFRIDCTIKTRKQNIFDPFPSENMSKLVFVGVRKWKLDGPGTCRNTGAFMSSDIFHEWLWGLGSWDGMVSFNPNFVESTKHHVNWYHRLVIRRTKRFLPPIWTDHGGSNPNQLCNRFDISPPNLLVCGVSAVRSFVANLMIVIWLSKFSCVKYAKSYYANGLVWLQHFQKMKKKYIKGCSYYNIESQEKTDVKI